MLWLAGCLVGRLGLRGHISLSCLLTYWKAVDLITPLGIRDYWVAFLAMYFDWWYSLDHRAWITCFASSLAMSWWMFGLESDPAWEGRGIFFQWGQNEVRLRKGDLSLVEPPYVLIPLTLSCFIFFFIFFSGGCLYISVRRHHRRYCTCMYVHTYMDMLEINKAARCNVSIIQAR